MSITSFRHAQLGATFNGIVVDSYGERISQFKSIKYAQIPARFERAIPVTDDQFNGKTIDATKYGCVAIARYQEDEGMSKRGTSLTTRRRPRCPQAHVDVRHLLRIPEDYGINEEPEDEFECLNLDITLPDNVASGKSLPVLIWIYGMHAQVQRKQDCHGYPYTDLSGSLTGGSQAVTFCSAASGICGIGTLCKGC